MFNMDNMKSKLNAKEVSGMILNDYKKNNGKSLKICACFTSSLMTRMIMILMMIRRMITMRMMNMRLMTIIMNNRFKFSGGYSARIRPGPANRGRLVQPGLPR